MKQLKELLLSKGADQVQIYALEQTSETIQFKNNTLNQLLTKVLNGMRIEIVKDGQVSALATSDFSQPERIADLLLEMVQYGDQIDYDYVAPGQTYPELNLIDPKIYEPTVDDLVTLGEKCIEQISEYDPAIQVNVTIRRFRDTKKIINSRGLDLSSSKDVCILVNIATLVEGDNFCHSYSYDYAQDGVLDYEKVAQDVINQMKLARTPVELESGQYPVIFTPQAVSQMTLALQGLLGEYVAKGISPLKNKIGTQIFHEAISFVDDGSLADAPYTNIFDDEGTPTQRTVLVEQGVLKQFLHNLESAAELDAQPTGNAFKEGREYQVQPSLNFTNLIFEPGDRSYEDMLSGIEKGLIIDDIIGLMMGNVIQGVINSDIDMAYKIENGKVVGRVKNGALGTSIFKLFKDQLVALEDRVTMRSMDAFGVYAPHILCKDVNITIG